jgi:tetratricopeptide (TPR) repeat protein
MIRSLRAPFLASCAAVLALAAGCTKLSQSFYLRACDRDVERATRAIEKAADDRVRAAAHAERGSAWGEKARYSRAFSIVSGEEYERLFANSMSDHDRSVALDARSAEAHFRRGRSLYDRAVLEKGGARRWFDLAAASFEAAGSRDASYALAWDFLGLARQGGRDWEGAIQAYTKEAALVPLGRARLADLYCDRGSARQSERAYEGAITDLERSVELGAKSDGCSCEPYNTLLAIYATVTHEDGKAWEIVRKAKASGKWIAPELLDELKKRPR